MMTGALCDDVDHWYVVCGLVLLMLAAVVGVLAAIIMWRRRRRRERSASLCSAIRNGGGGGGPKSKSLSSQPGSLVSIASTSSSRSTAPLIQVCMVGGDVTIPERRHSTRSATIDPGQIRSECYTNDVTDDGKQRSRRLQFTLFNERRQYFTNKYSINTFNK